MPRPQKILRQVLLLATVVLPQLCSAQDCESLNTATPEAIVSALDHGEIKTEFCARAAFQLIERLPKDKAIPILILYLGFREPLTNAPRSWESLYPAIDSLYNVGLSAEQPLIDFLAQNDNEKSIEHANAIEALALIRHADVVPTIKLLRQRSAALAGTPASARLEAVARYMLKTYCRGRRQLCEKELRQSN
jgi:hypothetical protein